VSIVGRKGKLALQTVPENAQDIAWLRFEDVLTADVFGNKGHYLASMGDVCSR
jgi:hypothetical protein